MTDEAERRAREIIERHDIVFDGSRLLAVNADEKPALFNAVAEALRASRAAGRREGIEAAVTAIRALSRHPSPIPTFEEVRGILKEKP